MALSKQAAEDLAYSLMEKREGEAARLERLFHYRKHGVGPGGVMSDGMINGLPADLPGEVRTLARLARVNLTRYVVTARTQNMYVDGYQTDSAPENVEGWDVWQANGMDAAQIGVHRAALTFGAAYVVVLPGSPVPVLRAASPRNITVVYDTDEVWPYAALWKLSGKKWRLIDSTTVYEMVGDVNGRLRLVGSADHGVGYCPVIRFRDTIDLDCEVEGVVEPLTELQDQINITAFGLLVAQHYGAFRQRYILGWIADSESQALKTGASRLMMFEDGPDDIKVGEFQQTELRGYIESREASIRHLATVSQTPVHELMGQFVNLSADALEAARASHHAATEENQMACGESWEQTLRLAAELKTGGQKTDDSASVVWRDTRVRSLKEAAEAFGLLTEKLGIPPRVLWGKIPGIAQHEVARWEAEADKPGAFDDLKALLAAQGGTANGGAPGGAV